MLLFLFVFGYMLYKSATYLLSILPSKTQDFHYPTSSLYHKFHIYSHFPVFDCLYLPLIPSMSHHQLDVKNIFFIKISLKLSTYINPRAFVILPTRIMFVYSKSLSMA